MNLPWSRSSTLTPHVDAPSASTSLASFFGLTGPSAQDLVRARIAELAKAGSLDAANGDVLDAWLDSLRAEWHAQCAAERTERVAAAEREMGRLEAESVAAQRRAHTAADELGRAQKFLTVAEKSILEPAEAHAGDKRERRRRPRATVDSLEGLERRWWHGLFLKFLVLMAAVGDVVTFNVTLSAFFTDSGPMVLWGLTFALAAASVGLMHTAGHALRNLREGRGGHGRLAVIVLVFGWLVIGAVAVAFRIQVATPVTTQQSAFGTDTTAEAAIGAHDALLSAILLGGLFIGSGFLAFYAGFSEHHPRMKTYLSMRKQLPKKHESATRLALEAEAVRQSLEHVRGEADRARQRADDARGLAEATVAELKELVRVEISGHMGMPEATTGLTGSRHVSSYEDPDGEPVAVPRPRPSAPDTVARQSSAFPSVTLWGGEPSMNGHRAMNGHGPADGSR